MLATAACRRWKDPWLEVVVVDDGRPVAGVEITARSEGREPTIRSARTDSCGRARIQLPAGREVVVEALLLEEEWAGFAARTIEVGRDQRLRLEISRDFRLGPALCAYERSSGPDPDLSGVCLTYDLPELQRDRRVRATLEIDRVRGTPQVALMAPFRDGQVGLREIFSDVGIELEVVWSDEIPGEELAGDLWPGETRLRQVMKRHRDLDVEPGRWHLYLILVATRQRPLELSLLIDPEYRRGAVVQVDPLANHAGENLHAIAHEIGHMLNLPHPWEVYGNTRSIMSYPWRWLDWDWNDPRGYRFDPVARRHILRGPETHVRPGRSAFLGYAANEHASTVAGTRVALP